MRVAPGYYGGRYGQSIGLDGGGVAYPTTDNLTTTAGTISLWAYLPTTPPENGPAYLFGTSAGDAASGYTGTLALRREVGEDGALRWAFWTVPNDAAGGHSLTAPDTLPEGWHHIAVTWEATTGSKALYLDGVPVAQTSGVALPSTTGNVFHLGRFPGGSSSSGMYLDDLATFRRALPPAEIAALAAAPEAVPTSSAVITGRLRLDINASDAGGIMAVQFGHNGVFGDPQPYYDTYEWDLRGAEGPHEIVARVSDIAGNQTYITRTVALNLPPRADAYLVEATRIGATLALSVTDEHRPLELQVSHFETFAGAAWQPLRETVAWAWRVEFDYNRGDVTYLPGPVYVRFR
ncbi:MAG: LamG domain-containing protein, partial [Chloroflexaceae bacterium]|nr:LamG domain-containing protein [Chloroflexaceae bacterium]